MRHDSSLVALLLSFGFVGVFLFFLTHSFFLFSFQIPGILRLACALEYLLRPYIPTLVRCREDSWALPIVVLRNPVALRDYFGGFDLFFVKIVLDPFHLGTSLSYCSPYGPAVVMPPPIIANGGSGRRFWGRLTCCLSSGASFCVLVQEFPTGSWLGFLSFSICSWLRPGKLIALCLGLSALLVVVLVCSRCAVLYLLCLVDCQY